MTEENAPVSGADIGRWLLLGLFLAACIAAYFAFAPKVRPIVKPYTTTEAP
jgi:hypothetical protein